MKINTFGLFAVVAGACASGALAAPLSAPSAQPQMPMLNGTVNGALSAPASPAVSQQGTTEKLLPAQLYVAPVSQPERLIRYTVDLNMGYSFSAAPNSRFACDMFGGELEGAYYLIPHHALTVSAGVASGGKTRDFWVRYNGWYLPFTDSYDRMSITLMPGYRFSHMIGKRLILQVGAKAGLDIQSVSTEYGYRPHHGCYDDRHERSSTSAGLGYAGYAYVGFFVTKDVCVHLGYQYKGSTATPSVKYDLPWVGDAKTRSMRWHEVRAGVSVQF